MAPFASDMPNASHDSKNILAGSAGGSASSWRQSLNIGQAGPFRSDAAGFGHPLTALHTFTKACLGLSYAHSTSSDALADALHAAGWPSGAEAGVAKLAEPWGWLFGQSDTVYAKGFKDALYVFTWVLIWTALRAAVMRYVLVPLGSRWVTRPKLSSSSSSAAVSRLRHRKVWEKNTMRFAEQSWSVIFYAAYWSLGLNIAYHSPYWFQTAGLWTDHPHEELTGKVKFYYLTQCAFWFHQLIVINVEAPRKDHWQMFSHHIITICLIVGSYVSHFTRVGNAILILMDPSDIGLSAAKCLRYVGLQTACDVAFGVFMLTWIVARHILYWATLFSCILSVPEARFQLMRRGEDPLTLGKLTMQEFWETGSLTRMTLTVLLCALQVLLLLWFVMIVRVAYRVITGAGAADTRSDEELSDEDEQELQRMSAKENRSSDGSRPSSKASNVSSSNSSSQQLQQGQKRSKAASSSSAASVEPEARSTPLSAARASTAVNRSSHSTSTTPSPDATPTLGSSKKRR